MDFYLEALDKNIRKSNENPSIGIILCSDKDNAVVKYSIARTTSPTMISTYQTKIIDKKILEKKIMEYRELFDNK